MTPQDEEAFDAIIDILGDAVIEGGGLDLNKMTMTIDLDNGHTIEVGLPVKILEWYGPDEDVRCRPIVALPASTMEP